MAVTYNAGYNPFWYFPDLNGQALVGGYLWSFKAPNLAEKKPIYANADGTNPYPNPMPISANGLAQFPMFFADDANYLLQIRDGNLDTSQVLYQIDSYNPASGGSSPPVTSFVDLTNYITNGQFAFNMSPGVVTPVTTAVTTLAPSNHSGLTTPDIVLRKNSTASTDSYQFIPFNQGDITPTLTPRYYLNYICSVIGAETQKDIQFPISAHSRTLENTPIIFSFWAQSSSSSTIEVFCTQYFGDGSNSPSAPINSTAQPQVLTPTWTQYWFTIVPPNTLGKTIGNCGNDYLVMTIRAPLSQIFNISVTNVMLVNATGAPPFTYNIQDHTDAIINSPRTGDVKTGYSTDVNNNRSRGWLLMNDATIGSASSGATGYAGIDTFPLYKFLYDNVADAYAPVSGGRSGDAATDFAANKTLGLTIVLGRALASAGNGAGLTPRPLGSTFGEEGHVLTIGELASHNHPGSVTSVTSSAQFGSGGLTAVVGQTVTNVNLNTSVASQGGNQAHNTMQPTSFINVFIKL